VVDVMRNLSLVKKLSYLKEEQRHSDELMLDAAGLAFTRGTLVEVAGGASTGKTSLLMSVLAKLTAAGEICAVVDSTDGFDPCSAVLAGVELENLLWVKCGRRLEKAFMAADYLVQAKGFGAVWLNLSGLPQRQLNQVPRTYWYRYRTRIKETPTLFFVTAEEAVTGSASQQSFTFSCDNADWSGKGRFKLLRELRVSMHSRKQFYGTPLKTLIKADYTDV
jgi:RecA/RadA recombinase